MVAILIVGWLRFVYYMTHLLDKMHLCKMILKVQTLQAGHLFQMNMTHIVNNLNKQSWWTREKINRLTMRSVHVCVGILFLANQCLTLTKDPPSYNTYFLGVAPLSIFSFFGIVTVTSFALPAAVPASPFPDGLDAGGNSLSGVLSGDLIFSGLAFTGSNPRMGCLDDTTVTCARLLAAWLTESADSLDTVSSCLATGWVEGTPKHQAGYI